MVWIKSKALDYSVSNEIKNDVPKDQKMCLNSKKKKKRRKKCLVLACNLSKVMWRIPTVRQQKALCHLALDILLPTAPLIKKNNSIYRITVITHYTINKLRASCSLT